MSYIRHYLDPTLLPVLHDEVNSDVADREDRHITEDTQNHEHATRDITEHDTFSRFNQSR